VVRPPEVAASRGSLFGLLKGNLQPPADGKLLYRAILGRGDWLAPQRLGKAIRYTGTVEASGQRITLELHGSKAEGGVELDGLEGFIDQFRRALREFERTLSAREHEVGRTGQPGGRTRAATGFRLVHFRVENPGVAELEPLELTDPERQLVAAEPRVVSTFASSLKLLGLSAR